MPNRPKYSLTTAPAIYLGRCPKQISLSRIGGKPHLPKEIEWPKNPNTGRPLHFLVQIDLAAMPKTPLPGRGPKEVLPTTGLLLFFADMEYELLFRDYGANETTRVVYVPNAATSERQLPDDLPPLGYEPKTLRHWKDSKNKIKTWPMAPLEACVIDIYDPQDLDEYDDPTPAQLKGLWQLGLKNAAAIEQQTGRALPVVQEDYPQLPAYYLDRRNEETGKAERYGHILGHQLLGPAHMIQCEFEDAKDSGRIPLLQLRSEKGVDLAAGEIQYWIKPAELAARKFEKAFATFEC